MQTKILLFVCACLKQPSWNSSLNEGQLWMKFCQCFQSIPFMYPRSQSWEIPKHLPGVSWIPSVFLSPAAECFQLLSRGWVPNTAVLSGSVFYLDILSGSVFPHLADSAAVCGCYLQYLFLCSVGILLDLYFVFCLICVRCFLEVQHFLPLWFNPSSETS